MAPGHLLCVSAASTAASVGGLLWWVISALDEVKGALVNADSVGGGSRSSAAFALELLLSSRVTLALLANFVVNVLVLFVLLLKTLFFVQLHALETRNLLERVINYMIYKGTFLPLVVSPNLSQVVLWSTWLIILCFFKMFQLLARDRLERLNASPTTTPSMYFRVYSALLLVFSADILWMRLCLTINTSLKSSSFVLLFFEPLSIAFEMLQAIMVHGFQLLEISQRHSVDTNADSVDPNNKTMAGSLSEWKGFLIRHCGFILDLMSLVMGLGHYLITWWLHGMTLYLADAVLFLHSRALVSAIVKRVKVYIKLWKALASLDGALPDATSEELCTCNDECAICREPMARAKRLSCGHLFHLGCLRSWLDQGLTEVYSCPTCWRPLCFSNTEGVTNARNSINNQQPPENPISESNQQRVADNTLPTGAFSSTLQDPSDSWRSGGIDSGWVPPWTNPSINGASTSSAIRSLGLSRVQMMMRQLASGSDNYSHSSLDDGAWNLWPPNHASGSSSIPPSSSRFARNAGGIRRRNISPSLNGNMEILAMVARVREVLPHVPDEVIVQDLLRTNNINMTVNNLLVQ